MPDNQPTADGPPDDAGKILPSAAAAPETLAAAPPAVPALTAAAPSPAKSAAAWCAARARESVQTLWKFAGDVGRYYWGMRQALWEYIAGHAPLLLSESVRMREVRLAPDETHALAEFDSAGWRVAVPGRCVVCGEPTTNPPIDEFHSLDDAARAFWVPVGTVLAGAALGLVLWDRRVHMLAIVLGPVLGYALRGKVAVQMRVARCDQHVNRTRIPQILVWGNTLVLRFGHKLLRKVFLYGEQAAPASTPNPTSSSAPVPLGQSPGASAPETSLPQTIPLADSPAPADATITHDRPAEFEMDQDSQSPLVP